MDSRMPSSSYMECTECGKVMLKRSFYTHLRNVHRKPHEEALQIREQMNVKCGLGRIVCPLCSVNFTRYEGLAEHCRNIHSEDGAGGRPQNYSAITMNFASSERFEEWFLETCESMCTAFFKAHEEKSSSSKTLRYLCNRAGTYTAKAKQRNKTSKKNARHCSCHLVVRYNADGTVIAKGCLGHVGHELDPALLRFTSKQIMYLKELLEEHSMDYIINMLREEDPTKSSKLSFVIRSDLHNIARRFNMTPVWHKDDLISSRIRYDEHNADDGIEYSELPQHDTERGFLIDKTEHERQHFDGVATWTAERCEEFVSANSDFDVVTARDRREARYQKLSEIKRICAEVEAAASSLAELDSNEALTQLEKILSSLKLVLPSSATMTARVIDENSQMKKIPLHQRARLKKPRKLVRDLHEKLEQIRRSCHDE